jgi:hypothetical protein
MAKLLAYYNLCPINNVDEFLGLSKDAEPGCVINTLGRNIILIVKVSLNSKQHHAFLTNHFTEYCSSATKNNYAAGLYWTA